MVQVIPGRTQPASGNNGTPVIENIPATEKIPFEGMDMTWQNGNDRRDSSIFHIPFFTPSILVDANVTQSFNNPVDHTVIATATLNGFNTTACSANFDYTIMKHVLWRTEGKVYSSPDAVFPENNGILTNTDAVFTTSLSVSF